MEIDMKKLKYITALALFVFAMLLMAPQDDLPCPKSDEPWSAAMLSEDKTYVMKDGESDYKLVFSTDSNQMDATFAYMLQSKMLSLGALVSVAPDTFPESEREILLGDTTRPISSELGMAIAERAKGGDLLVWGYTEKDGKLAYTANTEEAFRRGEADLLALIDGDDLAVERGVLRIFSITRAEYERELEEEKATEREALISALRKRCDSYELSDFGGAAKEIGKSSFKPPHFFPTRGAHPRLIVTEGTVDDLKAFLSLPENEHLKNKILGMADKDDILNGFTVNYKNGVLFRYSETQLAELEAKALSYLITGDEVYGIEAIIAAKEMLLTLVYPSELHMDTYHGASHTMTTVALVFDWCYGLMSEDDKLEIIAGVVNLMCPQMEYDLFENPKPTPGAVSGHGTGPQILRDYVTVALAFYDEAPDLWEYVGGMFYEDYVPVIDVCYAGGWGSQGTGGYGTSKYYLYTWAAAMIKSSTGEIPYENADGARLAAHFWLSHLTAGNETYFSTGDSTATGLGIGADWYYLFPAAWLYGDPNLAAVAYRFTDGYSKYFYNFSNAMTPALMAAFASGFPDFSPEEAEKLDTVQYFSSPAGQMTARSDWSDNAAVVLMKIGEMTMSNHDNLDHGTFQIWYKGLLAADSGAYNKYLSNSHRYYRQSTVAYNGLLIFNPTLSDSEPVINGSTVTNAERYYYSGSQVRRDEATDINVWLSGSYDLGTVTAHDYSYAPDGSAEYAYIAGDVTAAYDARTVDLVARRMLTVFTGDQDVPMIFFTFDSISSKEKSYRKSFLLHTVNEPEIDKENLTAEVKAGDGRLILQSVTGADKLVKIGGKGYAYWISNADYENPDGTPSGKNCTDSYTVTDGAETVWGRLELSSVGECRTDMLTAMYVTDKNNDKTLPVLNISTDELDAAQIYGTVAAFVKSEDLAFRAFSLKVQGNGLYTYFISGIETGTWHVTLDGVRVATVYSEEGSGLVSFIAPTGEITLTPGSDVIGESGGRIIYETGGATLPSDAPSVYKIDTPLPLPANLSRGNDLFMGWYTSPSFDDSARITHTPTDTFGTLRIYARWLSELFNEDYSDSAVNISDAQGLAKGVTYNAKGKKGASFVTGEDQSGKFLTWTVGENDPHFHYINTIKNLSTATAPDSSITYTVKLSPSGDAPVPSSDFRIISKVDVNGADIPSKRIGIFRIAEGSGEVYIGDTNVKIAELKKDEITTLKLVVDFKEGKLLAYDDIGDLSAFTTFTVPSGVGTTDTEAWMKCFNSYVFYWYGHSTAYGAAMRIYSITVEEGNRVMASNASSAKISYVTGGGLLPSDAPRSYSDKEPTVLPTPTRESSYFYGWYTSDTFDEETRVTEVPTQTEGVFTVYAKWGKVYVDAKYNETSLNVTESNKWLDGITYKSQGNVGASFKTELDSEGKAFVRWTKGESDPFMHSQSDTDNFSASRDSVFTYTATLRALEGKSAMKTNLRIISKVNTSGVFSNANLFIMRTDDAGNVTLGDSESVIATLSELNTTTVRIAVDFESEELRAYSERGEIIAKEAFDVPTSTGAKNGKEWQRLFTAYLLYWYAEGGEALAIYRITVSEGDVYAQK